jgi:phage tail sheath protein FI
MSDLVRGVETVLVDSGVRPIETVRSSVIGLVISAPDADADLLPLNTPKLFFGGPSALRAAIIPTGATEPGTGLDAINMIYGITNPVLIVVRVDGEDLKTSLIGDATLRTGVWALLNAKSLTGIQPRILCAPCADGYTIVDGTITAAPVAAALCAVAERLRAIAIIDGPNDDAAAANTAIGLIGSKRGYMIDPWVKDLLGNEQPPSPMGAALFNRRDNAEGFAWSPSNTVIPNISGTSRPIDFALGDAACEADILAGFHVNTIIREDGFRLWGVRTAQTTDTNWFQITRVRIADIIADSIQAAHLWAIDRPITKRFVEDVVDGVNAYMRTLKARSIIVDGSAWADLELNTPADLNLGHLTISYDFCDHPLAEKITLQYNLNTDYLTQIVG